MRAEDAGRRHGTFDLGRGVRFDVWTPAPDSSEASLTMCVFTGSDERFDETRTVTDEGLEFVSLHRAYGL